MIPINPVVYAKRKVNEAGYDMKYPLVGWIILNAHLSLNYPEVPMTCFSILVAADECNMTFTQL